MKQTLMIATTVIGMVACGTTEPQDVVVETETMVHQTTDSVAEQLEVDTINSVNGLLDALGKQ